MYGKMKHYTDLFIDLDDTLYDTHGNAVIALRQLFSDMHFEKYGIDEETFYDAYWRANIDLWTRYANGDISRDFLIIERFRKPMIECSMAAREDSFYLNISDRFLELCSAMSGVVDGAHELMDYLKAQGYRMHICSNGFHEVQSKKLKNCGLLDYFDSIILSEDAGANKPQLQFFDYAKKISNCIPGTSLMIGDNYNTDILGAMAAGLDTILFNRWDPTFEPPETPTFIVNSLKEIQSIL